MSRRFTSKELFILRNEIEIEGLIENHLLMSVERIHGRFRFACPICACFDTSINKEKNLAKCFKCNINFNTIDMVMRHMNLDFVPSVKLLKNYHENKESRSIIVKRPDQTVSRQPFTAMSEIIPQILPRLTKPGPQKQSISDNTNEGVSMRIDELENKIDRISRQLDKIIGILSCE
jgi:hypothetical protein